ncbi:MAG: N-acetyl sugar amidotransferase WbpG [Cytophagales bacterium]|jgi:N-acetyl sugar amidotransferase|nr:N-acetyl sugar amidotransferase [Bacteroidota bacterium]MBS1981576.1 N-acetyl sugar amidotransferase [Bacteroidota bacterium]WHZ08882.1 MAG: N-acetyl sugar amidotransferase WbpG [Cytophagales bacterium]
MILSSADSDYQQCAISVMDNIADPDISFDEKGICNYYYEYKKAEKEMVFSGNEGKKRLEQIANNIKQAGRGKKYDCILGLSGGIDSTYLALLAKQLGLKPLLVHFDYGWNSEIAVQNIERAVNTLGFDLYTHVMDWDEFKDILRAYFKASVLDLDVPADHMIFAALFKTANKYGIKYMLSGNNVQTEHTLPKTWNYNKFDIVNLRNIHNKFGERKLKHFPKLGLWYSAYYRARGIQSVQLLNCVEYNKMEVKKKITEELGWKDYGGKHHESVFTRFYQGYILPNKFHIDKRKAHLSNLIFSGQLTKPEALKQIESPPYDERLQMQDKEYIAKKLGFSTNEFDELLRLPNRTHQEFGTDVNQRQVYFKLIKLARPLTSLIKKVRI